MVGAILGLRAGANVSNCSVTATSVTGTGDITTVGGLFTLTGTTAGTSASTSVAYTGFTTADGTTVAGAVTWTHLAIGSLAKRQASAIGTESRT